MIDLHLGEGGNGGFRDPSPPISGGVPLDFGGVPLILGVPL